ncbi:MAG: PD40 domain-containing protein [Muribaculaceae bacterium]|nr:PD40 domain-containing protein [Muribaculaceae bacterium]
MKINKRYFSLTSIITGFFLFGNAAQPSEALWLRDVQISPDGTTIAFQYKGDIWTVPVGGGQATRLTTVDSYESTPIWSPDSKNIAFASDRNGNFDIFVMPATGGKATRLTRNSANELPETFAPNGKEILFSAAIQDPASSALFPSARLTELYAVPVTGGSSRQILASPAEAVSWGDGIMLYQDQKGMEDQWRKHHTSSVTRDIWKYDPTTAHHTNLTAHAGEDRNPVVAGDVFYFLSERDGGSMNVYVAPLTNPSQIKAVTNFKEHPVRFLSRAQNGMLAYTYNGEIYTQKPDGKPTKITVTTIEDIEEPIEKISAKSGAREATISPDGKSVAFIYRGDVYVTSVEYGTTKQISSTPEEESYLSWSPDGKELIYSSQRDGRYNIYKATMARPDEEINFANATVINEEPLFKTDKHERTAPAYSPDGKKLAFILDRNRLQVMDVKSGEVKELTDGSTFRNRGGAFNYVWSPDNKWIAMEIVDKMHDPYYDIAIINVNDGQITNLTGTGYFDENPRWVLDGNAILFASDRYGMRNHASWGSEMDAMLVFMNQDAYDKYRLSPEDYELTKDIEKAAKKKAQKDESSKDDKKDNDDKDAEKKEEKTIEVDLTGIQDRVVRLTPMSSDLSDAIITEDGENLYYIVKGLNGNQLWKKSLRKDEHKMVSKLDGGSRFEADKDGKTMLIFGSRMQKFEPKSDKFTPISYTANMNLDHQAERNFMYDYVVREEAERFYTKDMHGVNWQKMTDNYRRFLPHINNNYDFAELLSELLGELNVSHTGGRYYSPSSSNDDRTASLGLLYDLTYTGNGVKVDEVLIDGPFNRASSRMAPGSIVTAINNKTIDADNDLTSLLTDMARKKTLVTFVTPEGETVSEVVLPISAGANNELLYQRWVKRNEQEVDRLSNGRLGYVHIRSMGDPSFREVYSKVLGKYNDRDGIVIDIRWNGGGRLHEDIEILFSGKKYFTQEIRGDKTCDMPSRRWNKPSIMITNEACYSNAHGTPWVYKHQGLGKVVGAPVPGTMTSVNWVTMQDPSLIFGIPVVGYRLADGSVLENQQLEPDILVLNDPETVVLGVDEQLQTAVRELLKDIDGK